MDQSNGLWVFFGPITSNWLLVYSVFDFWGSILLSTSMSLRFRIRRSGQCCVCWEEEEEDREYVVCACVGLVCRTCSSRLSSCPYCRRNYYGNHHTPSAVIIEWQVNNTYAFPTPPQDIPYGPSTRLSAEEGIGRRGIGTLSSIDRVA